MIFLYFFHSQDAVKKSFIVASREEQMENMYWIAFH